MKHSARVTAQLLSWFFVAIAFGLFVARNVPEQAAAKELSQTTYIILIVAVIGISALLWYLAMRKMKVENVEKIFAIGIALALIDFLQRFFGGLLPDPWWARGIIGAAVGISFYHLVMWLFSAMQSSWRMVRKLLPISNVLMIVLVSTAGAMVGVGMQPWAMAIILFAAACYDAWAVWHSGTMQKMAKYFMARRVIPGIAVAKPQKEKFALLGGGDILFIVAMSASFWRVQPVMMYISAAWMSLAVLFLFGISEKKKFYPALPFIFGGMMMAYLTGVFLYALGVLA